MSTLPVRYTNNHHVASSKTASPIVVAVNKAAVAGCVQSAAYHRHQQQMQHQQRHHHTPPVKRHPTKMAAARRAKSRSRTRTVPANPANLASTSSPAKRRSGAKAKQRKLPPQLMSIQQKQQQQQQQHQQLVEDQQQQEHALTAQQMVLDVSVPAAGNQGETSGVVLLVGGGSGVGLAVDTATVTGNSGGIGSAEWTTQVGGDVLRTPDAAGDRLCAAIAEQQHQEDEEEKDQLMDTSEAMDEDNAASCSASQEQQSPASTASVSTMTSGEVVPPVLVAPRRSNEELFAELQEALALEPKYQPMLYLPHSSQDGEITIGARDGAAHVLRCLKVWYELPTDVLFAAINLVDRFLAKMKVRPKHLACISVGSLYLAAEQLLGTKMNTEDLALISQCRCTAGDLERMAGIIANKLGVQPGTAPVTALTFIRLFYNLFRNAAFELGLQEFYEKSISLAELEQRLEVLASDATCSSIRASELALVLICTQMDSHASGVVNQQISGLVDYAIEVQKLARIPDQTFFQSHAAVVAILARYNSSQHKMPYKQRLVWKLSSRTMRVLRPSNKMTSYLPTIDEHNQANFDSLSRFRTGSLSSEDDEDWPTSPVVPVYEELC